MGRIIGELGSFIGMLLILTSEKLLTEVIGAVLLVLSSVIYLILEDC